MFAKKFLAVVFVVLVSLLAWSTQSLAGEALFKGRWIAESFGNDKVGIGTEASRYFNVDAVPLGTNCHPAAPLCDLQSTPVTTTGNPNTPGAIGTAWAPLGPACRPLTGGELPRPPKGGTLRPGQDSDCGSPPCPPTTCEDPGKCLKTPPLYRNPAFFTNSTTPSALASNQSCSAETTIGSAPATAYLPPWDPQRGIAQAGSPVQGYLTATTTGTAFKFPAAASKPPVPGDNPAGGMMITTDGSFIGTGPYLYSYTYADLRNNPGNFGAGGGFFSAAATPSTLTFKNKAGGNFVATATVKRGTNRFGGVMQLLGSYGNKVCYFYAGGCALGYNDWRYHLIGGSAYKAGGVVTASSTTTWTITYFNTALETTAKYDAIAQRFPWTTGSVTLAATGRGPNKTWEQRKGFDNRAGGVGTVQLVSPILTQWLGFGAAPKFETGGIAVMELRFVPEPGVLAGLVAGVSALWVLRRFRS